MNLYRETFSYNGGLCLASVLGNLVETSQRPTGPSLDDALKNGIVELVLVDDSGERNIAIQRSSHDGLCVTNHKDGSIDISVSPYMSFNDVVDFISIYYADGLKTKFH